MKSKVDESRSRSGLKCLLYDARMRTNHDMKAEEELKKELKRIDPNMGLSQMACEQNFETSDIDCRDTRFGKCQVGSYLFYQVAATESNFKVTACIDCIPRLQAANNQALNYPRFPLRDIEEMLLPDNLTEAEKRVIDTLQLDEDKVNQIETETRQQAECEKWKEERKFRFTASQFQLISKRQRNHEGFAETLMNPKPVSSKYLEHGKNMNQLL